jgi:hypothetical protein
MAIEKKSLTGKKTAPKKNPPKATKPATKLKTAMPAHNLTSPRLW